MADGIRRPTRQAAPAKAWLATVANPTSSSRSASSRCATRSEGGSSRSVVRTQKAVHTAATGHHEKHSGLPHQPGPERPALEREAGLAVQVALIVAQQVAQEPLGHGLGLLVARALRPHHARPPEGIELRE